jgi:hypothetical protein
MIWFELILMYGVGIKEAINDSWLIGGAMSHHESLS